MSKIDNVLERRSQQILLTIGLAASPSRPPTLMTHHGIAQSVEKRNPNSPENRPRTRGFLQKRLFQTRSSAALLNGFGVLHGRLRRQLGRQQPSPVSETQGVSYIPDGA